MIYKKDGGPSLLGLGIMRWPNKPDYKKSKTFIDLAYHNGVNYFEACMFYNNWNCEKILSSLLKDYKREEYFLCDKMPIHGVLTDGKHTPEEIFEHQLNESQVEYFDYYLLQAVDRLSWDYIQDNNVIQYLHSEKERGRIRNLGFSFHDNEEWLTKYLNLYDWDCVQLQLNYVDWYINNHKSLYEKVYSRDIPIFVMGALKGGQLSYNLPKSIIQLFNNENSDSSIASWGMNFLGSLPGIHTIVTGATEIDELQDNINTFSTIGYTDDYSNLKIFKDASSIYAEHSYLPCTGCKYCERQCPTNIQISRMFTLYNKLITNYNDSDKEEYLVFSKDINLGRLACKSCNSCSRVCPQKINIPKTMNDLAILYR